jgi:hypothetical protein
MRTVSIEIFRTNVQRARDAIMLANVLFERMPGSHISFDLDDCDKILRVKHTTIIPHEVTNLLRLHGFICEVLED